MKNSSIDCRTRSFGQTRRGFSLTELAIVLGIIGLILGAIWVAAGNVNEKNSINKAALELQTVSQNILTLDQNRPFPAATEPAGFNLTTAMINAGAIPSWMVTPAATASHPWSTSGFAVWVVATNSFRISFYGVPIDACIALLLQGTGCDPSQTGCPQTVRTGGTAGAFTAVGSPHHVVGGAPLSWATLTPSSAELLCAAGGSVEFEFLL